MKLWIISLGGSLVAPDGVDVDYVSDFYTLLYEYLQYQDNKFVLVVGGGAPARVYQQAYRDIIQLQHEDFGTKEDFEAQDRIGIKATHLNACLIKEVFSEFAEENIVHNPEDEDIVFEKPVLIGAGWKPGFSTDLDAVVLANRFGAETIINLSNIPMVYSADPALDPKARALDEITWSELIQMVGDTWSPGLHAPFDPVACKLAEEYGIDAIVASGRDIDNLKNILDGKAFVGTRVSS